jgi:Phenylpropionate dioxygenase and related ring-hydroxylating dioxygenases, large terminal subunit
MSIDCKAYSDDAIFRKEVTHLFNRRLFVGTIADFPEVDSYKTIQMGHEPITVRRTPEGIKAFSNVCLHRGALIDPQGTGTKPFRCPYHAWAYDSNGALSHTPKVDMACLKRTQLYAWRVNVEDGLVFIGQDDTAKVPAILNELSISYSRPYYRSYIDHECNWKLLVENVLEGYHISAVHPKTFVPTGITSNSDYEWSCDDYVCWGRWIANTPNPRNSRLSSIIKGTRLQYGHAYIFPNVFVSNGNDHIGYIGHFIPTGPTQTRLEWCLFEQALLLRQNETIRQALRDAAVEFTRNTLTEDKAIVESCQIGLQSAKATYQLQDKSNLEARVINFQSNYERCMRHV